MDYRAYFLAPNGENLHFLVDSTQIALEALKIWWNGVEARNIGQELERKGEKLGRYLDNKAFPAPYQNIAQLLEKLLGSVKFNQRNFINIHPMPLLPVTLAAFLVSIQNPNNITQEVSPVTSELEGECIEFYKELIGFPKEAWGTLVGDGTLANLTALLVARDERYYRNSEAQGPLPGMEGLYSRIPGKILTTANVHYSIEKAMWILGLGNQNLIKVPVAVDEEQLRTAHLNESGRFEEFEAKHSSSRSYELKQFYEGDQEPFTLQPNIELFQRVLETESKIIAMLLTAGTTQTGTIENIPHIFNLRRGEDIYVHIDAAIGGYGLCIPELKEKLRGIEKVDSVTIDGHKLGFINYPCGAIIFQKQQYRELIEHTAPYLKQLSPTIEGSRPGSQAAACWLAHKILGKNGYQQILHDLLQHTQFLRNCLVESDDFQIYHKIDLNTIVFGINRPEFPRTKINQLNLEIAERINRQGRFFVNVIHNLSGIKVRNIPTERNSQLVDIQGIRVLIMNPYTDEEIIKEFISVLQEISKKLIH
ncbi:MAG: pyridoxal phosphate-dependent decarboxylase family protein [Candidatus Helarchaeota archaeon]